ncbi:receptor-like protein 7 [Salvia hispanica]|uniref:receptor-like protein 7 n=1 Tax=Salvia hispanica TaxID=49212 RepID=UPI0020094E4E|nr:receptor-like protein 7 [Salvia hispanica]
MLPKLLFIFILISSFIFTAHSYNNKCLRHQKTLLLQLSDELSFDSILSTKLVRWNETVECCKWHGVECDASGNVVSLQLDDEAISGGIGDSSSLFRFKYLQKHNLAYNGFNYTHHPIPKGIGNFTYLTHLNLSSSSFGGQVPVEISSLKRLVSLDISNYYSSTPGECLSLEYPNLEMLVGNLTELRELNLDGVNITSSDERQKWSHIVSSHLPNLTTLSFRLCSLSGPLASLKGSIPSTFANLTELIHVDLGNNLLTGSLPSTLFEGLSKLAYLYLRFNSFYGNIPHSLYALPSLLELDLCYNQFSGTFQLDNFQSFPNLTLLDLSGNSLSIDADNVNSISYGDLQLKRLYLASCNLSNFPDFIKDLDVQYLDLSNNSIAGEIPSWIWGTQLIALYLRYNLLTDFQKPYHIPPSLGLLYLDSNQLRAELQLLIPLESELWLLTFANNSLSGSIPTSLCKATAHKPCLSFFL